MQAGVKERYDTFIANMIINGMNGALAVRETPGYSNKRARQTANRLSTIGYVKEGIAKKQAELAKKTAYTQEIGLSLLLNAYNVAERLRQPAAMVSAVVGANRMHGFDKDANIGEKTVIIISPKVVESTPIEPQEGDKQVDSEVIDG